MSNSTERTRRFRERKRQGVVCMINVPIYYDDYPVLQRKGLVQPGDQDNYKAIAEAVDTILTRWIEENRTGDPSQGNEREPIETPDGVRFARN